MCSEYLTYSSTAQCPSTHPYMFDNGAKCCANYMEKTLADTDPADPNCTGGLLKVTSSCCLDDKFEACAAAVCLPYIQGELSRKMSTIYIL